VFVWEEANRVRYHVLVSVVLTSNTTGGTISVSIAVVRASVMLSLMRISLLRRGKECASEAVARRLLKTRRYEVYLYEGDRDFVRRPVARAQR